MEPQNSAGQNNNPAPPDTNAAGANNPSAPPSPPVPRKSFLGLPIFVLAILGILLLAGSVGAAYLFVMQPKQVACTMEAKICPDGSSVGRTGPKCEFAPCPTNSSPSATSNPAPTCTPQPSICKNPLVGAYPKECDEPAGGWCPEPTCIKRPACLDAEPRCLMAEPINGWCPSKENKSECSTDAECPAGWKCTNEGPLNVDLNRKKCVSPEMVSP